MKGWIALSVALAIAACSKDGTAPTVTPATSGLGSLSSRYTAEVWVHGSYGYTSTWGMRVANGVSNTGNMIYVWDVRGANPVLVDSVAVQGAGTIGDVQVSPDGRYLVACTEPGPGSVVTFDLANPVKPRLISTFVSSKITRGVHTTEIQVISGKLYAFLSVNLGTNHPSRVMIVDLSDPTQPKEVSTLDVSRSFVHDVFVRDGLLFAAQWNNGMVIFDIGGGGKGGSLQNPVQISSLLTAGGLVHNIWWFHDPSSNGKRYAFVGQEGPGTLFNFSSGDVHVVDISNLEQPREVAFFNVPGAGTHNFAVDEANGLFYAAYYNGGVYALDIRGDLGTCTAAQKSGDGRCNLELMGRSRGRVRQGDGAVYVWGVQLAGGSLYASDMLNGLWKLRPLTR